MDQDFTVEYNFNVSSHILKIEVEFYVVVPTMSFKKFLVAKSIIL